MKLKEEAKMEEQFHYWNTCSIYFLFYNLVTGHACAHTSYMWAVLWERQLLVVALGSWTHMLTVRCMFTYTSKPSWQLAFCCFNSWNTLSRLWMEAYFIISSTGANRQPHVLNGYLRNVKHIPKGEVQVKKKTVSVCVCVCMGAFPCWHVNTAYARTAGACPLPL